jgi:hypothetical protein
VDLPADRPQLRSREAISSPGVRRWRTHSESSLLYHAARLDGVAFRLPSASVGMGRVGFIAIWAVPISGPHGANGSAGNTGSSSIRTAASRRKAALSAASKFAPGDFIVVRSWPRDRRAASDWPSRCCTVARKAKSATLRKPNSGGIESMLPPGFLGLHVGAVGLLVGQAGRVIRPDGESQRETCPGDQ